MPCNIFCNVHNRDDRMYDITAEQRVWPCCFFANGWDKRFASLFKDTTKKTPEWARFSSDEQLMQYFEEDENFNNLEVYDLDTILDHPLFQEYAFFPGWESDSPPVICKRECSIKIDEVTGKQVTKSSNDASDYLNGTK